MVRTAAARKTPTNVSIRADLVKRAKELGLNLSGLLESALEQAIRKAEAEQWMRENEEAIDYYNAWVKKHGSFADQWRKF
jgi:antitoxin CcdA